MYIIKGDEHPQEPVPIKTDNNAMEGFLNKIIQQKMSISFNIKFH